MKKAITALTHGLNNIAAAWAEYVFQPTYVLLLLAELLIFLTLFPASVVLPSVLVSTHLLLLYTIGFLKARNEGNRREAIYQNIIRVSQGLLILGALVYDWKMTLLFLGIQICVIVIAGACHFVGDNLICLSAYENKTEDFIHKYRILFSCLILCIPTAAFIVALCLLPATILTKIGVMLAATILTITATRLSDESVTLYEVFIETTWSKEWDEQMKK